MQSICPITNIPFTISETEQNYCKERGIPLPTTHPLERWRKITSFRNRIHLFNSKCALSGRAMLSAFPPEKGLVVYDMESYISDSWDATTYGLDYDPSRPFFEQFAELLHKTPIPNLYIIPGAMENSDYVNGAMNLKNCYLCFSTLYCNDCMFDWAVFNSNNVLDSINCYSCEICYSCRDAEKCYNCLFVESSHSCTDSAFLFNCQSCKDCYGCVNLNNKQYCWFNEQLTKEEFEVRKSKLNLGNRKVLAAEQETFQQFKQQFPIKYYQGKNIENCTGNYLLGSKNSHNTFFSSNTIDSENCFLLVGGKDCCSVVSASKCELSYSLISGINYNCQYCFECLASNSNLRWCMFTNNSTDCFGCISLKKKQYCILNKQYSKEDYERLTKEIQAAMIARGEWGEFFPQVLNPYPYNESDAMLWFPLTKEEAVARGYSWKDEATNQSNTPVNTPDDIKDVTDAILQQTLTCAQTGKAYRITKQELETYRRLHLPIPTLAPLTRLANMAKSFFNQGLLHTGNCAECQKTFETVYDTTKRKVLCEECYVKQTY